MNTYSSTVGRSPFAASGLATATGLSMVELLVSIVLGLLLTTGIVTVYLESKSNYLVDEENARIQENGRFAINFLKRELTQAGFFAANLEVEGLAPVAVGTDCVGGGAFWAMNPMEAVDLINDYTGGGGLATTHGVTLTCLTGSEIEEDTDILAIKRSAGEATLRDGVFRAGVTAADDNQWYVRLEDFGDAMSWVFVGSGSDFPSGIGAGSRIDYWEMYASIFYIRNFSTAGDGLPTLCVERLTGNTMDTQCLVEGVEDMQIEFGIDMDIDGVADRYEDAPTPAELASAVVARVYLLIRSISPITGYTNTKTYQLGQKAVGAKGDGYLRRVFSTTVQMRNATLPVR